jgi:hypothetical protein
LPTTQELATVPELPMTPALANVAVLPTTPAPLTVPALPTTPELSAGPTVPSAICDASLVVRSAFLAVRGDLPRGEVSAHGVRPALPGCRFTARA